VRLRRRRELLLAVALSSALVGCRGKLLSPSECEFLAERVSGITSQHQLRNPRLRSEVRERTERCLLRPYDRELVRCFHLKQRLDLCEYELEARLPR
jgi:hypothetical protein